MKSVLALLTLLGISTLCLPGYAIELSIAGRTIETIETEGLGTVSKSSVDGGIEWIVKMNEGTIRILKGHDAVLNHLMMLSRHLENTSTSGEMGQRRLVELSKIIETVRRVKKEPQAAVPDDCAGSLNFTPSFSRNLWYGRVWSEITFSRWSGPAAPWTMWIHAIATATNRVTGSTNESYNQNGPFGSLSSQTVMAFAMRGPESTGLIRLIAEGGITSTGCDSYWFMPEINELKSVYALPLDSPLCAGCNRQT